MGGEEDRSTAEFDDYSQLTRAKYDLGLAEDTSTKSPFTIHMISEGAGSAV
jgi:hypothetical protein